MSLVRVTEIKMTCGGCPTSWEGVTDDGREVYARYRWGYLRVTVGDETIYHGFHGEPEPSGEDLVKSLYAGGYSDEMVRKLAFTTETMNKLCEEVGQQMSYDGYLSYEELREHTKEFFVWPESETG